MTINPYAPATPENPDSSEADAPGPGVRASLVHGAKRGSRIAAFVAGGFTSLLIIPALAVTAFGLGSGRGFGVPSYFLSGIGTLLFFIALGGIIGTIAGLIGELIRQARARRVSASPGAPAELPVKPAAEARAAGALVDNALMKRRRPLWPWFIGVLVSFVLATAYGAGAYVGRMVDSRSAAAIIAADRDDPYWRLDDLLAHREQVPDDENSALVVNDVLSHLPATWPDSRPPAGGEASPRGARVYEAFTRLGATPPSVNLDDHMAETLRGELKKYEQAVLLARSLANYNRGRHELEIGPTVLDTRLAQTQAARNVARLLAADAAMRAHDGDIDGALETCRAILEVGRSIGDEPFLISQLVRFVTGAEALKSTWRVLGQGEPSDAALARLQALVLDELAQPLLLYGVKGERAALTELLRRLRAGELTISALSDSGPIDLGAPRAGIAPWGKLWFDYQHTVALEWLNEAVAVARRPVRDHRALWQAWDGHIEQAKRTQFALYAAPISVLLMPAIPTGASSASRYQSELGATAILIAAERHRRKTGVWPAAIAAIDRGILPNAPADPFTGAAFRIEHGDGQLRIYTIGPNGKDEHGEYEPRRWSNGGPDDAGARAWDVSLRRRPPASAEE